MKKRDPIYDETLTSSISLKDKVEETKDGEKGAPSPSYKYYSRSRFLSDPPFEAMKEDFAEQAGVPDAGEPIPEDLSGESAGAEWWDEESSAGTNESEAAAEVKNDQKTQEESVETAETEEDEEKENTGEWWAEEEPAAESQQKP